MKKVSVTDKYTYDGKEMTERDIEVYEAGKKSKILRYNKLLVTIFWGTILVLLIGVTIIKNLNH